MSELISKEALRIAVLDTDWHDDTDADVALDMIDEAPTVEERMHRHGHWISKYTNVNMIHFYKCSVCYKSSKNVSPFCQWCGASMSEVNEND